MAFVNAYNSKRAVIIYFFPILFGVLPRPVDYCTYTIVPHSHIHSIVYNTYASIIQINYLLFTNILCTKNDPPLRIKTESLTVGADATVYVWF